MRTEGLVRAHVRALRRVGRRGRRLGRGELLRSRRVGRGGFRVRGGRLTLRNRIHYGARGEDGDHRRRARRARRRRVRLPLRQAGPRAAQDRGRGARGAETGGRRRMFRVGRIGAKVPRRAARAPTRVGRREHPRRVHREPVRHGPRVPGGGDAATDGIHAVLGQRRCVAGTTVDLEGVGGEGKLGEAEALLLDLLGSQRRPFAPPRVSRRPRRRRKFDASRGRRHSQFLGRYKRTETRRVARGYPTVHRGVLEAARRVALRSERWR
mmetsp:Transcript_7376/g.29084  ORF Transcript_7376/g.29084 Transcript_7376/m.29084 type:complete len:267 (-) Transcript_7376:1768-2568(-)